MQTKMRVNIARTEINVTREKANGKKLILQKIILSLFYLVLRSKEK